MTLLVALYVLAGVAVAVGLVRQATHPVGYGGLVLDEEGVLTGIALAGAVPLLVSRLTEAGAVVGAVGPGFVTGTVPTRRLPTLATVVFLSVLCLPLALLLVVAPGSSADTPFSIEVTADGALTRLIPSGPPAARRVIDPVLERLPR